MGLFPCSSGLASFSDMLIIIHIPEDADLHCHNAENLRSCTKMRITHKKQNKDAQKTKVRAQVFVESQIYTFILINLEKAQRRHRRHQDTACHRKTKHFQKIKNQLPYVKPLTMQSNTTDFTTRTTNNVQNAVLVNSCLFHANLYSIRTEFWLLV
jgi:hypothetical protein